MSRSQYSAVQYSAQYSAQYRAGWWSAVCRAQLLGPTPQQSLGDSRNTSTHSALHTAFTHSFYTQLQLLQIQWRGNRWSLSRLWPPPLQQWCRGRAEDHVGYSPDKRLPLSPRLDRAAASGGGSLSSFWAASLQGRASNEGSRRFHSHGEGPGVTIIFWPKWRC